MPAPTRKVMPKGQNHEDLYHGESPLGMCLQEHSINPRDASPNFPTSSKILFPSSRSFKNRGRPTNSSRGRNCKVPQSSSKRRLIINAFYNSSVEVELLIQEDISTTTFFCNHSCHSPSLFLPKVPPYLTQCLMWDKPGNQQTEKAISSLKVKGHQALCRSF